MRTEDLLTQLEAADPAAAPDIADELTAALAGSLDEAGSDDSNAAEPFDSAEPAGSEGGTP
jgi:hypothetical protein